MKVLSLFAGIGGFDIGLEAAGCTTVGQVEIEDYPTSILEKHWPKVKRWRDICTVSANDIRRTIGGGIDLICGGFPCQDISSAGEGEGLSGARSGLWREMWRLIRDLRPAGVFVENSPTLRTRGADRILAGLEALNYTAWPMVVEAAHAGAGHHRARTVIVAYANGQRFNSIRERGLLDRVRAPQWDDANGCSGTETEPDLRSTGRERGRSKADWRPFAASVFEEQQDWESPRTIEPDLVPAIHGIPWRLAIKAIGNAFCPPVAEEVAKAAIETARIIGEINGRTSNFS